jgi:CheY-like chemotaxis protein
MHKHVLIVDDYKDSADLLAEILVLNGHNVTKAYSGADAISAAIARKPSFVLLDLGMPVMDGFEVARQLRRLLPNSLRIIAMTAWGDEGTRKLCFEAGFDLHIQKPINFAKLLELLR